MHAIRVEPKELRFPNRCLRCGAPPTSAYMMPFGKRRVEVPLCEPCSRARFFARAAWVVGGVVGSIVALVCAAMILDVVAPLPSDPAARKIVAMLVAVVLMVLAGVLGTTLIKSALRRHRSSWDPVLATEGVDEIAFRNPADARDALAASLGGAAEGGYRAPADAVAPYVPKGDPLVWVIPAILGVGSAIGFVVRWTDLNAGKEISVSSLEAIAFEVGGRFALLGFWVFVSGFFLTLAVMFRRGRRAAGRATASKTG